MLRALAGKTVSFAANDGEVRMGDPEAGGVAPFLEGRVAMISADAAFMAELVEARAPFEWEIVSSAVSLDRSRTLPSYPSPVYAIYKETAHRNDAWRYVSFMNDPSTMKLLSKSTSQLSSHPDVALDRFGRSLEPFYGTPVAPPSLAETAAPSAIPPFFASQSLHPIIDDEIASALDGRQSLEETLQAIRRRGQEALDFALAQPRGNG